MPLTPFLQKYASFNLWSNQQFASLLESLPEEILTQRTPSSFNTIGKTITHIMQAEKFWMLFVTKSDFSNFSWRIPAQSKQETLSDFISTSQKLKELSMQFTEADLEEELVLDMPWAKNRQPRYDYIIHVINHGTYHRGQLVTMLRSLGVTENIPGTDYNMFSGSN